MKYSLTSFLLASLLIQGCVTQREVAATRDYAEELLGRVEYSPPSLYIDEPVDALPPVPIVKEPAWLDLPASVSFKNTAFSVVADAAGQGRFTNAYTADMDPGHPLTISVNGNVREVIQAMENASNYVAQITGTGVRWSAFEVEVFHVDAFPGTYRYLHGKTAATAGQGGGGGVTGQITGGLYDVDSAQYSNQQLDGADTMLDVEQAIWAIVGDRGTVKVTAATGMVMVKATPDSMVQVRKYMESLKQATAQILLELKIVRLTRKKNSAWGIDWSLIRKTSANSLTFDGQVPTTNLFGGIPSVIGVTRIGSGASVGSKLFLNILDKYADVTVVNEQRVLTTANRMYEIEAGGIQGFLANSQIQTNSDGTTIATGETEQVREGFSLYALTKPVGNGEVMLALSNRISDITDIRRFELFDTTIETPIVEDSRINITNKVRSGNTLIVASILENITQDEAESPFSAKYLPTYQGDAVEGTELLVMVTPRIVDTGAESWPTK